MPVNRLEFAEISQDLRDAFNPFPAGGPPEGPQGPFRIGELSRHSGVAVGTIKYYLREGLLPPGEATARTQALYGPEHLRRLRVLGVLGEIGGLSIAQLRRVAALLDEESGTDPVDPTAVARAVTYALPSAGRRAASRGGAEPAAEPDEVLRGARVDADAFIETIGFAVGVDAPARAELAEALAALRRLGVAEDPMVFYEHARLAYELAEIEIASSGPVAEPTASAEAVTVGSVVFGAAFMALRRLAHEHEMRRMTGADVPAQAPPGRGDGDDQAGADGS